MRPRASLARLGGLAFAASLILGGAACGLVAGLDKLTFQDPAACAEACDDLDPCTEGDCLVNGACKGEPVADGPLASDPTGNCQTVACAGGVATITVDAADVPHDDGNSCTDEACTDGAEAHTKRADGESCTLVDATVAAVCNAGKCAATCTASAGCDDHEPCTIDACDPVKMLCAATALDDGTPTPGVVPVPGDCRAHVCVAGVDTNAPDDLDLVSAANDCIAGTCTDGVPSSPPKATGTPCTYGGGQVCDGAGACVACNVTADCAPTGDECKLAVCNADKTCGTMDAPVGTQLSAPLQIKGNCKTLYCDGTGAAVLKINDGDLPDDGNPCTIDACKTGVPTNTAGPSGVDCGVAQKCNAAGKCGCADATQCNAPDTCGGGNPGTAFTCGCTKTTCAAAGATCGLISDGCFATLMCNSGTKNGAETDVDCGGGGNCAATCAIGKVCKADTDCGSGHCADGVCCNTACAGTCTACNLPASLGTCTSVAAGASDPVTCVAPGTCDGAGACKKANGGVCAQASQCTSGNCVDGYCCNTTCTGTCMACSVVGKLGTCSNLASGKPDPSATVTCVAPNACNGAGVCAKTGAQACALGTDCVSGNCADGVCCNTACTMACMACNLPGSPGVCSAIATGKPDPNPANACGGGSLCDGMGACKLGVGQPCLVPAQCLSGVCAGGVCQ